MSALSGIVAKSEPGLPRGRSSLDPFDVAANQRTRLLRAVISAVAANGYQATTISDIVERARVSRSVMYREFDGKLDCFLAAIRAGRDVVVARIGEAIDNAAGAPLEAVLASVSQAYLETCLAEWDHTRAWVLELAAAGPEGVAARAEYLDELAGILRDIDATHGSGHPRPPDHYTALVGGIAELVSREVRLGDEAQLARLQDVITQTAVIMLR